MFSFGLANFLSLSDRMSDMLKKFSTSLNNWKAYGAEDLFVTLSSYTLITIFPTLRAMSQVPHRDIRVLLTINYSLCHY